MVVIPKSVTPSRITENIKATEVKLDAEDMKRLRELESKNFRSLKVLSLAINVSFGEVSSKRSLLNSSIVVIISHPLPILYSVKVNHFG